MMNDRKLRVESLEERTLLAVLAGGADMGSEFIPAPAPSEAVTWVVNTTEDPTSWNTGDSQLSLREAIFRAAAGDTILFDAALAGGTITLRGTELEIRRGITIDATGIGGITIDGNGRSRVFYVTGGTVEDPVDLVALTITGGKTTDSGGGGIINIGTLTLTDCTVEGNRSSSSAFDGGGCGIFNSSGMLTLTDCTVAGNTARYSGGGIYNSSGTLTLTNCTVSGNTASYSGGGIYNSSGTLTLTNCTVAGNTARYSGGIYNSSGTLTLTNCTVAGNTARYSGGGIYNSSGTLTLTNCTVAGNTASGSGGGIYNRSTLTLTNSIVALNDAGSDKDIYHSGGTFTESNNIIGFDPGFTVAPVFESGSLTNLNELDLSLTESSWAIDRGDNGAVTTETDIVGNLRIVASWKSEATVDIGAYEYQDPFVKIPETPSVVVTTVQDIVNVTDGLISLREAILYAAAGDTILFDAALAGGTITLRGTRLEIRRGITIDATEIGGITIDGTGRSRVFYVTGGTVEDPVDLLGLTITGGETTVYGGGIYNSYGTLTLTDCTVTGNTTTGSGGGIYNSYGTLTLTNCTVTGNTTTGSGGGIYNSYGTLTLTNCTVAGNTAGSGEGGGICNDSGTLTLTNCTVAGNTAGSGEGGGICNDSGTLTLTNCTISGNTAGSGGGGISNKGS
ncbi:MAG: right-handed parallel beta-helix repeat-containing protein, partial [Thermoguttaceae bacterium]